MPGAMSGFDNYAGRSFILEFFEGQQEVSPARASSMPSARSRAYVKSADEVTSRIAYIRKNPLFKARFALGPLGGFDHGVQVTYDQGQLKQLVLARNTPDHDVNHIVRKFLSGGHRI